MGKKSSKLNARASKVSQKPPSLNDPISKAPSKASSAVPSKGPVVMDISRGNVRQASAEEARTISRHANDQDGTFAPSRARVSDAELVLASSGIPSSSSGLLAPPVDESADDANQIEGIAHNDLPSTPSTPAEVPTPMPARRALTIEERERELFGDSRSIDPDRRPQYSPINFSVTLDRDVAEEYVRQADAAHQPLSSFLSERLHRCIAHNSPTQLTLTDEQRLVLGKLLSSALTDADELIRIVRGLVSIRIKGTPGATSIDGVAMPIEFTIDMDTLRRAAMGITTGRSLADIIEQFSRWGWQQKLFM